MPTITELKAADEKLISIQNEVGAIFDAAKNADGGMEFRLASEKSVNPEVKGKTPAQIADYIGRKNAEMSAAGKERESLMDAQKAHDMLSQSRNRPPLPGAVDQPGGKGGRGHERKSIAQQVEEHALFKAWHERGAKGGLSIKFEDFFPSDYLAQGGAPNTIGMKTLFETTAGWAPESVRLPGFVEAVTRPVQLLDIIPVSRTGQEAIKYMEETTRTHAAAEKAEGVAFAESTFQLTERTQAVEKITDSVPVTDEQLEDVAMVSSYLQSRLTFGLRQRLDLQCLLGNNTPPNLRGIKAFTGIQTQAKGGDPVPDAIMKAMTLVRVTGRAIPTHVVIHSTDWQNIRLLRTVDGLYIWGHPSEAGPARIWGLPVVEQDADTAGTAVVGSFMPAWISLFERRGITVDIGYVGDQFKEGKRTIRADTRWSLVGFRGAAFCTVTGL
jgi:HK97 family phage major capsid protein